MLITNSLASIARIPDGLVCIVDPPERRQRGTKRHPGTGVGMGTDHTIFAIVDGVVEFATKRNERTYISVRPNKAEAAE